MTIILIKLFLNIKLDLIWTKYQICQTAVQKDRKVLLWNQVKSKMETWYSELVLNLCWQRSSFQVTKPQRISYSHWANGAQNGVCLIVKKGPSDSPIWQLKKRELLLQSNLALRNFLVTTKKFLKVKSSLFQTFNQSSI